MKKLTYTPIIAILLLTLLLSGCGTSRISGDPGATMAGAAIGGNVGGAIGGLIGDSNNGWRGRYRGSAIGTIVGTVAGAAIGNAATTPKKQEEYSYKVENTQTYKHSQGYQNHYSDRRHTTLHNLKIRNIRFIDSNRNHVIEAEERCKVVFEIMNEGNRAAYNVVPVVVETTGMKHIYISSSVMIEQIAAHEGVKYTASIGAGNRLKTGEITIRIAVADEEGNEYDWQEFSLPTQR